MRARHRLAAGSRDSHLALRRVERQQVIIERLSAAHGQRIPLAELADEHRVSVRTLARDVERLRLSGLPLDVRRGRQGGVRLVPATRIPAIAFDLSELAALVSSLTVLGPTVSASASSAMQKLTTALVGTGPEEPPPDDTADAYAGSLQPRTRGHHR